MKFTLNMIKRGWQELIGSILPPTCIVCDVVLPATEPRGVCPNCWNDLPWWDKIYPPEPKLERIDYFSAPLCYEDAVMDLVAGLKYADKPEIATALAMLMKQHLPDYENAVLAPVPIHAKRMQKRFFNQSILLAKELSKLTGIATDPKALIRIKHTPPQVGKSAEQRRKNIAGAFKVCNQVVGKNVIIIDDVMTTGSTVMSCAKELKKAGAEKVAVVTLAYTPLM